MTHPLVTPLRHTTLVYVGLLTNKLHCVRRPLQCDLAVRVQLTSFGTRNSAYGELSARGCKFVLIDIGRRVAHNAWSSTVCWLTQRKTTTRLRSPIAKMTKNNYLISQERNIIISGPSKRGRRLPGVGSDDVCQGLVVDPEVTQEPDS